MSESEYLRIVDIEQLGDFVSKKDCVFQMYKWGVGQKDKTSTKNRLNQLEKFRNLTNVLRCEADVEGIGIGHIEYIFEIWDDIFKKEFVGYSMKDFIVLRLDEFKNSDRFRLLHVDFQKKYHDISMRF